MKVLALIGAVVYVVSLAGCSSPYLPHTEHTNALTDKNLIHHIVEGIDDH